ncbi:MAG: glucose 1-dehydrogenase [Sphingomonadales bacterium]|nr:glucose 1-dehydrogenase [Sphingomonadales bacterium]PIX67529.1 MAG: short-chain dehydrogenase [Sphingomonadales bacterium CG_4_10_14_3_um_filter_58_15]NCO50357.1 glucose 1-dehydrogenase [Sphingomonadales bacterium]NCP00623.1 glucose 1-dehydrogenase [Sphingomonadales bacterium]NCP25580.1 glucose 1-dehydrogenase [Sphingomonadales bacterium]
MTERMAGKVALVTGGASRPGLGAAIGERLAEEGATVVLSDVDLVGVEETARLIRAKGGNAIAVQHDVASQDDWDGVIAALLSEHGRLDVLVNNAGILEVAGIVSDRAVGALRSQFEVNVMGSFIGTQMAVKAMRQSGGGSIVNMSSVAGLVGFRGSASYAASKGAVKLFSKSVALEVAADNIRVNTVHPGIIRTNMQDQGAETNAENYAAIEAAIPAGRLGEPLDIANCVLFLASDESTYVTGAEFVVDGGYTAQ